jgi:hypothetical protein
MKMYDEKQAATFLACSVGLLRKKRLFKTGPAFIRIGRLVRYKEEDLIRYLAANRVPPRAA